MFPLEIRKLLNASVAHLLLGDTSDSLEAAPKDALASIVLSKFKTFCAQGFTITFWMYRWSRKSLTPFLGEKSKFKCGCGPHSTQLCWELRNLVAKLLRKQRHSEKIQTKSMNHPSRKEHQEKWKKRKATGKWIKKNVRALPTNCPAKLLVPMSHHLCIYSCRSICPYICVCAQIHGNLVLVFAISFESLRWDCWTCHASCSPEQLHTIRTHAFTFARDRLATPPRLSITICTYTVYIYIFICLFLNLFIYLFI